jgi:hypothetical protein
MPEALDEPPQPATTTAAARASRGSIKRFVFIERTRVAAANKDRV